VTEGRPIGELARQHCEACTSETPTLTLEEVEALRPQLAAEWRVDGNARLLRSVRFKNFAAAFTRATGIALIAEAEGHHPELTVGWGHLDIELTTHAIGGLSRNDFIIAAKIDALDR
jgi:4a-hydroxytetrahydrobiopterin dehydratase